MEKSKIDSFHLGFEIVHIFHKILQCGHLQSCIQVYLHQVFSTKYISLTFSIPDIPYLRSLHLERNPLQKVEANAFEMIPQLVSLDLSHCNIKRVAARAFAQLTSLEKLFLQHNHIAELRQKTIESIIGEKSIAWPSIVGIKNSGVSLPVFLYMLTGRFLNDM